MLLLIYIYFFADASAVLMTSKMPLLTSSCNKMQLFLQVTKAPISETSLAMFQLLNSGDPGKLNQPFSVSEGVTAVETVAEGAAGKGKGLQWSS